MLRQALLSASRDLLDAAMDQLQESACADVGLLRDVGYRRRAAHSPEQAAVKAIANVERRAHAAEAAMAAEAARLEADAAQAEAKAARRQVEVAVAVEAARTTAAERGRTLWQEEAEALAQAEAVEVARLGAAGAVQRRRMQEA